MPVIMAPVVVPDCWPSIQIVCEQMDLKVKQNCKANKLAKFSDTGSICFHIFRSINFYVCTEEGKGHGSHKVTLRY